MSSIEHKKYDSNNSILVIDDDPVTRMTLCKMLRKESYMVIEATNGQDGLDKIDSHKPELVLLDVLMPGINGYETCQRLREKYS